MQLSIDKLAELTGHNASIFALANGLETNHMLSGGGEGWIVNWDLANPDLGKVIAKVDRQIFSLLAIPENKLVVAGNMEGFVNWANIENPEKSRKILLHPKGVFGLRRKGNVLYSFGGDGSICKWHIPSQRILETLRLSHESLRSFAFHPTRPEIAVGASDGHIYIINENDFNQKEVVENAHEHSVFSLAYHQDGSKLFSGGRDALLKVWSCKNGKVKPLETINAHWFTINDIAIHPKGKFLATASRDKTIRFWDTQTFKLLKAIEGMRDEGHFHSVNKLFWIDSNRLISCGDDRKVMVWQVESEVNF